MDVTGRRPLLDAPAGTGRGEPAGGRAMRPLAARDTRNELWLTACEALERREIGRWARAWR